METVPAPVLFGETHIMRLVCFLMFSVAGLVAQSITINESPSREFGQLKLLPNNNIGTFAPNLVEGRELNQPYGIAFDTSVTPPIMYVVDTGNNRILAWQNPPGKQA